MTEDTRIPQPPGTRGILKASKPLPSSVLASAPLKRHSPVPKLSSTKGTIAKSPSSSSSSDSSFGKKFLNGGKAITKISQEKTKDAAKVLTFESAVETAGKEIESLNQLSFECVEPDETKRITDMAEPSDFSDSLQTPALRLKDVVHSNLAASSWSIVDDIQVFDDHFMDRNSHMTISDVAAEASARPNATPESITNDDIFGGVIGGVCSTGNKPLQQENSHEDDKVVLEEVTNLETEDVSEGKDGTLDGSTVPKQSEGIAKVKLVFESLMREAGQGIAAAWSGTRALCVEVMFPASVLILCTVLLFVEKLIEDELDMLPPPT